MTRAILMTLLLAACGEPGGGGAAPTAPAATSPAVGEMCAEHGVLEAICTKHHPSLIPVFQAKGDWCPKHGFPESICPLCHPERGGRPAVEVGSAGDAPTDGTAIRFKRAGVAQQAGIEVAQALAVASDTALEVTARLSFDGTRVADISARIAGIVEVVHVDVGSRVDVGTPLATLRSASLDADRARLSGARARARITNIHYQRQRGLLADGLTAQREVLAAQEDYELAKAELASLEAGLGVVPATAKDGSWAVTAPFAGIVSKRVVTAGNPATPETVLFTVVDPSSMWAELDVPEDQLDQIAVGQPVTVTVEGLGERTFTGVIDYIAPEIDPHSRTAMARVPLPNPDGALRANMFATARVVTAASRPNVIVPRAAVQRVKEQDLVFVSTGPESFVTRRVKIGASDGRVVTIVDGLAVGEPVATTGSFLLKTEVLKDSIGAGCCEVD